MALIQLGDIIGSAFNIRLDSDTDPSRDLDWHSKDNGDTCVLVVHQGCGRCAGMIIRVTVRFRRAALSRPSTVGLRRRFLMSGVRKHWSRQPKGCAPRVFKGRGNAAILQLGLPKDPPEAAQESMQQEKDHRSIIEYFVLST